jgi:hypothetical protein
MVAIFEALLSDLDIDTYRTDSSGYFSHKRNRRDT